MPSLASTNHTVALQQPRSIERLVRGLQTSDGAGVKLTRVLTQDLQQRLDPWLMFDAFGSDNPGDYIGGFPDHPHRGFETITYMLAGRLRHRDSHGGHGLLEAGGVQWMLAGRGVIHSELPEQEEGRMAGFQLWLNLPAADKLCTPAYRDIPAAELPRGHTAQGVEMRVIAGHSHGIAGAIQRPHTEPLFLDLHLPQGSHFEQPLASDLHAFVYVYAGQVEVQTSAGELPTQTPNQAQNAAHAQGIPAQHMAILANTAGSDGIRLHAREASRLILVAGRPLKQPIVQHGPFVMNHADEIRQALEDYRKGRLG